MNYFKPSFFLGAVIVTFSLPIGPIAFAADSRQETVGKPWTGRPGVTESVNQIMDRERARPATQHPVGASPKELHPRFYPKRPLENNPDSPFLSHWPAFVNSSATNTPQTPLIPQTVGSSFLGAQISDTVGFIPPDSMGCVGPAQVMIMVNGRIKVFDKNGNLGPLSTTTDNFFSSVSSAGTSDGHIRYDRLSQRWFISMIDVATDNKIL